MAHFPTSSDTYRAQREALEEAEAALRDQRERVAELRRALPRDTTIDDLAFERWRDGKREAVRLSELFVDPAKPLVLMHFMFGKAQTEPCPMCTMWADGYAGTVDHLTQRANFAVLIASDPDRFAKYASDRGWDRLTIVSAANTTLKRDLDLETESGEQRPGVSVFERREDGTLVHFYTVSAFGPQGPRMMDLLSPVWNFFDLTPDGRGEFMPRRNYA